MNDELKIFAGTASQDLAQEMCNYLGIPIGQSFYKKFDNDNTWIQIKENVREKDVFIVQTSCRPVNDSLMEALIMADALKRASAKRITLVMPYYAYARSEKKDQPRVPITAALVSKLIHAAGVSRIVTMDLHAEAIMGFFDGPVDQLLAINLIVDYLKEQQVGNIVAVSPDAGGANRTRGYANKLGCPLAILTKKRTDENVAIYEIIGDVKGMNAIIFDDEIASGGTLKEASLALREAKANKISSAITHAVFGTGIHKNLTESNLEELIVTDTIPVNPDPPIDNLTVLHVAKTFGEAVKRIHTGDSISQLIKEGV